MGALGWLEVERADLCRSVLNAVVGLYFCAACRACVVAHAAPAIFPLDARLFWAVFVVVEVREDRCGHWRAFCGKSERSGGTLLDAVLFFDLIGGKHRQILAFDRLRPIGENAGFVAAV